MRASTRGWRQPAERLLDREEFRRALKESVKLDQRCPAALDLLPDHPVDVARQLRQRPRSTLIPKLPQPRR